MGQVIVRNLDDSVIDRHRARARAQGISLEQELRNALARTARRDPDEYLAAMRRVRAMTPERGESVAWASAEELVREGRDER